MESITNLTTTLIIPAVILIALIAIGMVLSRLYQRATKEISFVRTGFRGQLVVMNGGAMVLPVLHEVIKVNMNTLRLEVRRANEQALITRDRMRVDVQAEFYVRVQSTTESIANAAQTLGARTMKPESLKELVEGKFVDALRSVAAEMTMEDLHEQRVDFVQKVQQVVSEDLLKNGLELETVSLTGLDQTSREFFNPQNAFDAQGLTKLTEEIEERNRLRNEIEQDTSVAIQKKNLEAERQRLELTREEQYAVLEQQREIEIRRAAQSAEIAREQAERERDAEQAKIAARQQVDTANIEAEKLVERERIESEQALKERAIEKTRTLETAEILRRKSVDLAEQERSIAIAEKSREESVAKSEADKALALAVVEEEQVKTVRETEQAERIKRVELVEAAKVAEREAIGIRVAAEAEKQAAEDQAESILTLANAEADKLSIVAKGDAEATKLRAEAEAIQFKVDAEGKRAINESDNILNADQIEMKIRMALIENLPKIIAESVKPMEQIDDIKIYQLEGLNGHNANGNGDTNGNHSSPGAPGGNLADQMVNSALRYRSQAPLIDTLLNDIGLDGSDINGLTRQLADAPRLSGAPAGKAVAEKQTRSVANSDAA